MFGDIIQPTHLLLILVVALLVLGPKRLPEVGRSLGRGLRDFKHGLQGVQEEARGVFGEPLDGPAVAAAGTTAAGPTVLAAQTPPTFAQDTTMTEAQANLAQAPSPVQAQYATASMPSSAAVTKVAPVDWDPAEYAD